MKTVIAALAGIAVILAVSLISDRFQRPGRYQIVFSPSPGEYQRFLLLDSVNGNVFVCDLTACKTRPLQDQ